MSNELRNGTPIAENINGSGMRIAIIRSRFNTPITDLLLDGARNGLLHHRVDAHDIVTFQVPGAFELALAAQRAARTKRYDAIICIGAIIRGETAHFDFIAAQTAAGIAQVSREEDIPVIFCVLTTENVAQALQRSEVNGNNTGWSAAVSAIEMVTVLNNITD